MTMRTVTFRVDNTELFDALHKMNGDTGTLGARLVGVLLADSSFADRIGLAIYGVRIEAEKTEKADVGEV